MKLPVLLPALGLSILEPLLNRVINLDPNAPAQLAALAGKQLAVELLDTPFQLVLTAQADGLWLNQHQESVDCRVKVRWQALQQLQDPANITRLIRQHDLDLEGDLATLQKFSHFFQQLNPDWQEALARWIGDANSHRLAHLISQLHHWLQQQLSQHQQTLQSLAHDELQLSATATEVRQFGRDVRELEARTEHLLQQLTLLRAV